jgi:hypothetical protein
MPRGRPKKQAATTKQEPEAPKSGSGQRNGKALSKLEAVRRTMAELGNDAKPLAIQAHLKKTFGIDMDPKLISNYKNLVKKTAGGKPKGRKPKAAEAAQAPALRARTAGGISLDDIRAVKELSDRLGADKVRELVDLLAR